MINTFLSVANYFFNFAPPPEFTLQWIPWSLCALAIITAIVLLFKIRTCKDKILKKILQEYPGKLTTIALLLAINLLSRTNGIDVMSMRIFTYILFLWLLFAFYNLYKDIRKTYPERKNRQSERIQSLEQKYKVHKNKKKKKKK